MSTRPSVSLETMLGQVGQEVGLSDWFSINQDRIDAFADLTEDHQFIHVDQARAVAETPFGGTIAHGFLTLSMVTAMAENCLPFIEGVGMGINYGFDKVRFLSPVRSGSRVRGHYVLTSCEERKAGEVSITWAVSVEIEGQDKPALAAEWLTRQYITK
ncbi:MaoC family dehydratase [Alphaproteobacteria bacterium]|nr:MaoC family dehydratase [Alphaproteobacteria bacterium]